MMIENLLCVNILFKHQYSAQQYCHSIQVFGQRYLVLCISPSPTVQHAYARGLGYTYKLELVKFTLLLSQKVILTVTDMCAAHINFASLGR